jgi:TPP-dependent pyruvate/acetoin dehydrogenase alpha subunit
MIYATAIDGSGIPIATVIALSLKLRGDKRVVAACFGDEP